jgi:arylsulfatase A-like enzyme
MKTVATRRFGISIWATAILLAAAACDKAPVEPVADATTDVVAADAPPNFIFMIGDDMAVETLSCYGVGTDTAATPNIDTLCDEGVRLDNFWAQPVCSPTRATLLTGRYGFRTGVGSPVGTPNLRSERLPYAEKPADAPKELPAGRQANAGGTPREGGGNNGGGRAGRGPSQIGLLPDEYTFPMALKAREDLAYQTAAFGKWHLADENNGWTEHPQRVGFDNYAGILFGEPESYFGYSKVVDGKALPDGHAVYGTTDIVNDAVNWLDRRDEDSPFFLWVAFNAPHILFHLPPTDLLHSDARKLDPDAISSDNQFEYYKAMIEAMDTEIGRLLAALSDEERQNTYIVFMGDNGSPGQVAQAPFFRGHAKGSLYQGGVNVPFMMAGPGINGGRASKALTNSVDVYATVLELAGIDVASAKPKDKGFDSVSMLPALLGDQESTGRQFTYSDAFGRGDPPAKAIRNASYKLYIKGEEEELYNLALDPYESNNLLSNDLSDASEAEYQNLQKMLADLLASELGS